MINTLFSEFDAVSAKAWKQQIQVDLKGADYNDTLIYKSLEGIHVKPFYHNDETPIVKPITGHPTEWFIGQEVFIDNEEIASSIAIDSLKRGAQTLVFKADSPFDIDLFFGNIEIENNYFYANFSFLDTDFTNKLLYYFAERNSTLFCNVDPLGKLAATGNWFTNQHKDHEALNSLLKEHPENHIISVDTTLLQNSGATMVQQLAYSLSQANEYLNHFFGNYKGGKTVPFHITFKVAQGSNYFFEIAKIRALRLLYAALAKEYSVIENCHILATPSTRNKTLYDYNVNMLRSTTECMSAALGGANTIVNTPYDALYHKRNEFGDRISRNQLLILKAESYFGEVSNAADGSYYIESLTNEMAEKALILFKELETKGGFLEGLKEGTILKKIKESAAKEQALFDNGSLVLLGTNKHINKQDMMKDSIELYPFLKQKSGKTLLAPIVTKRLSENIEQERLSHE
ncbi:methylmalonyl-CoA mutase subunit beta [Patiriisocius marinus]|uniref:Methylmalonyl-CoA mutase n=1 Tax=Patiriisocius marinus TaxID=1397112 RepID=A0A5J4IVS9_9FLAO|nr:methylmalonyl-CoA mutase subunit beta [Patiriisocius marinus]GER59014.1 methylmalonyl-CoA mutase [Patiriisocius marinus]